MNPWKVSAQFAAYLWFVNHTEKSQTTQEEAARFANKNWVAFLPAAHEGIGRLLIKIGLPAAKTHPLRPRASLCARRTAVPKAAVA